MSLQNFDYNGKLIQRRENGFINLTQMCKANGKRIDNYLRLNQTQEYIRVLSNSLTSEVVSTEEGESAVHGDILV
jgi:glycine cleavage system aminomethyltransferase T